MAAQIVLVDKPYRWTSFQVVKWVRKHFQTPKAGHAGTLDPLATGLILVGIEEGLKSLSYLQGLPKEYYAWVRLGYRTLSDDAEFPPQPVSPPPKLSATQREELLKSFIGKIMQVPPSFSALKVQGERAYRLARKGIVPKLSPRIVEIYELEEVAYWAEGLWMLRVWCGKGTYIRSLARDLGEKIGCGGYLAALRRTRIGDYHVREAWQPDAHLAR
ncbi:MAG: tRNA pseudouridine(55) synthase TruB [Bacteroidia bacterium]|nr:tRNA pseudouridine(55) synthase TruB [Bacteroidia bacterium]MDW8236692.1 tRNA pseudouridine(55) synthase TruB [Bacteroidia bacterium]